MKPTKASCSPMFTAMFTAVSLDVEKGSMLPVNMGEHETYSYASNDKKRIHSGAYTVRIGFHVHHVHPLNVSPTGTTVWWGEHAGEHAVNMPFWRGACSPADGEVSP